MKRLLLLAGLLVLAASAANSIQTLADITGTGATVIVCSTCGTAKWVQINAPSTNVAVVRWGDANTSISRGALIGPGGGESMRPQIECPCDLSALYLYIAANDKVTITYGD